MKKKSGGGASPMLPNWNENAELDLKALQRERERLLEDFERIRKEKKRLHKETHQLLSRAKSLSRMLEGTHPQPEYLKREE